MILRALNLYSNHYNCIVFGMDIHNSFYKIVINKTDIFIPLKTLITDLDL